MNDQQLLQLHAETIKSLVRERVLQSAVTFLGDVDESAVALGSGTLVSFGAKHGVLTCAHTAVNLISKTRIGLGIPDKYDEATRVPKMKVASADVTEFFDVEGDGRGPDLAFIELSVDALALLKAKRVFLSMSKHHETLKSNQDSPKWVVDFVVGSVEDLNFKKIKDSNTETLYHSLMIIAGHVERVEQDNQFDFVTFQPAEVDESTIPNGYQGVSGGSLWRFKFELTEESVRLLSFHLTGVAFYQSAPPNRSIACHGLKSVFQVLAKAIDPALPN